MRQTKRPVLFNLNINQIEEAFIFWENANILKRDEKPLISSSVSEPVSEEKLQLRLKKAVYLLEPVIA